MEKFNRSKKQEEEALKRIIPFGATKGSLKLWSYFQNLVRSRPFQIYVSRWRAKYLIPELGYKLKDPNNYFGTPEEWPLKYIENDLFKEVSRFCDRVGLDSVDWSESIRHYIFYGRVKKPDDHSGELFLVSDLWNESREMDEWLSDSVEQENRYFPVAIRMSPYATKRDLLDFVDKYWRDFESDLHRYRSKDIKIGRIRHKDPVKQHRNDFIYENRKLPLRDLADKVAKKFDMYLDDGHISKIISLETNRRNKL